MTQLEANVFQFDNWKITFNPKDSTRFSLTAEGLFEMKNLKYIKDKSGAEWIFHQTSIKKQLAEKDEGVTYTHSYIFPAFKTKILGFYKEAVENFKVENIQTETDKDVEAIMGD